ncbi:MAG: hypothetical protein K0R51_3560, partial [Cytophagaceae bacterium]|nr:hypothetical protein [Cytophagaceae bacterium]
MADESKHQELQEKERQERQKILAEAENLTRELVLTEKTYLDVRGNLSEKLTNSLEWKKADKNVKNIIEILVQAHQKIS